MEIPELESGGDYEIISQLEDFIFALVESCLTSSESQDISVESCEVSLGDYRNCVETS